MSKLKTMVGKGVGAMRAPGGQLFSPGGSYQHTGILPRSDPATGDRGPDAEPDQRRRGRRGIRRNRRLGGDVRTPLSI